MSHTKFYVLDEKGQPVSTTLQEWASWMEKKKSQIAMTKVGNVTVSTVFLGFDHSLSDGESMLWETMVFGGQLDQKQDRCSTREQAEAQHAKTVEMVKLAESKLP